MEYERTLCSSKKNADTKCLCVPKDEIQRLCSRDHHFRPINVRNIFQRPINLIDTNIDFWFNTEIKFFVSFFVSFCYLSPIFVLLTIFPAKQSSTSSLGKIWLTLMKEPFIQQLLEMVSLVGAFVLEGVTRDAPSVMHKAACFRCMHIL